MLYRAQLVIQSQASEVVIRVFHSIVQLIHSSVHSLTSLTWASQALMFNNQSHGGEGKFLILFFFFFFAEKTFPLELLKLINSFISGFFPLIS